MTYQRNMGIQSSWFLEDGFDERLPERVEQTEVTARDDDEAEHDGGRLPDVATVGPLAPPQLVDAMAEERDDAPALAAGMLLGRAIAGGGGGAPHGLRRAGAGAL